MEPMNILSVLTQTIDSRRCSFQINAITIWKEDATVRYVSVEAVDLF